MIAMDSVDIGRLNRIVEAAVEKCSSLGPSLDGVKDLSTWLKYVELDGFGATVSFDANNTRLTIYVTKTPFWNHMPPPLQAEDRIREWIEGIR